MLNVDFLFSLKNLGLLKYYPEVRKTQNFESKSLHIFVLGGVWESSTESSSAFLLAKLQTATLNAEVYLL